MIRSLLLWAVLLVAAGCARVEPPPGGPEDRLPPVVTEIVPDSSSIVPGFREDVVFRFSERISETGVDEAVLVSPRTSPVQVDRGRSEIRVSLREGWQPDVVYHVTLRPDIRDLFNNALAAPVRLVFSTGPDIPSTRLTGDVIDRVNGSAETNLRVEAIRLADSLVYAVATDNEGRFDLDRIPPGGYRVRAFDDVNRNRVLNDYEARDTIDLEIAEGNPVEISLAILEPDSTGPAIQSVAVRNGVLVIELDDYLDPGAAPAIEQIRVLAPTGQEATVVAAYVGDTPPAAPADSVPPVEPSARPSQAVSIQLSEQTPLTPGEGYRVFISDLVNINGVMADLEAEFDVEAPPDPSPVPADTTDVAPAAP